MLLIRRLFPSGRRRIPAEQYVNLRRVRPYRPRDGSTTNWIREAASQMQSLDYYEVDSYLEARRLASGDWEYLVKWSGYDESANTWEPEANVEITARDRQRLQKRFLNGSDKVPSRRSRRRR